MGVTLSTVFRIEHAIKVKYVEQTQELIWFECLTLSLFLVNRITNHVIAIVRCFNVELLVSNAIKCLIKDTMIIYSYIFAHFFCCCLVQFGFYFLSWFATGRLGNVDFWISLIICWVVFLYLSCDISQFNLNLLHRRFSA